MQKLLFTVALVTSLFLNAQTEKGKFVFSGSTGLGFTSLTTHQEYKGEESGDVKNRQFSFQPTLGYFVSNGLYIGIAADFTTETEEGSYYEEYYYGDGYNSYTSSYEDKVNTTVIMPVIGYYFPVKGKFKPFAQFGIGLASAKSNGEYTSTYSYYNEFYGNVTEQESNFSELKFSGLAIEGTLGASYFINKSLSVDLGLSYTSLNLKLKSSKNTEYDEIPSKNDLKQKTNGLGVQLGFSVYL